MTTTTTVAPRPRIVPGLLRRRIGDPLVKVVARIVRSERMGVLYTTRKDASWRSTALGVWPRGDERYLVALFGDTWWVKDIRAGRPAELDVGGLRRAVTLAELTGDEGAAFWTWYASAFASPAAKYANASPEPTPEEAARLAAERPAFRVG